MTDVTIDVLLRLCDAQAELIRELMEPWRTHHDTSEVAAVIDDTIPLCIDVADLLREALDALFDDAFAGRLRKVVSTGLRVDDASRRIVAAFRHLTEVAHGIAANGYLINRLGDLDHALACLALTTQEFERRWPRHDPATLAESDREFLAGDVPTASEAFDGLRSADA